MAALPRELAKMVSGSSWGELQLIGLTLLLDTFASALKLAPGPTRTDLVSSCESSLETLDRTLVGGQHHPRNLRRTELTACDALLRTRTDLVRLALDASDLRTARSLLSPMSDAAMPDSPTDDPAARSDDRDLASLCIVAWGVHRIRSGHGGGTLSESVKLIAALLDGPEKVIDAYLLGHERQIAFPLTREAAPSWCLESHRVELLTPMDLALAAAALLLIGPWWKEGVAHIMPPIVSNGLHELVVALGLAVDDERLRGCGLYGQIIHAELNPGNELEARSAAIRNLILGKSKSLPALPTAPAIRHVVWDPTEYPGSLVVCDAIVEPGQESLAVPIPTFGAPWARFSWGCTTNHTVDFYRSDIPFVQTRAASKMRYGIPGKAPSNGHLSDGEALPTDGAKWITAVVRNDDIAHPATITMGVEFFRE
jgi:hypothetical protein